jgi:hypothetical protein
VTMVVSRAARKTEEQRDIMIMAVWSVVRVASGSDDGDAFSFAIMGGGDGESLDDALWRVDVEESCGIGVLLFCKDSTGPDASPERFASILLLLLL